MDQELNPSYQLSQSLFKHSGACRCVALYKNKCLSGGIDRKVNVYTRSSQNQLFEFSQSYDFFPDYVYSVIGFDDDKFIVGCKDGKIYICTYEDSTGPLVVLEGKNINFKMSVFKPK